MLPPHSGILTGAISVQSSQLGSQISGPYCYYDPREPNWGLPDWLSMVTTTILSSDATETSYNVLYTHPQGLGTTLKTFYFCETVEMFSNPTCIKKSIIYLL